MFAFANGNGHHPLRHEQGRDRTTRPRLRVELADYGVSTMTAYFALVHTPMITRGVDGDPIADQLLAAQPSVLLKRLQPAGRRDRHRRRTHRRATAVMERPVEAGRALLRGVAGPASIHV